MCYNVSDSERLSHLKVRRIEGSVDSNKKICGALCKQRNKLFDSLIGPINASRKEKPIYRPIVVGAAKILRRGSSVNKRKSRWYFDLELDKDKGNTVNKLKARDAGT